MSQFIEMFGNPDDGWKYPTKRLGEVYDIGTGGTPDRKVSGYYEGNIPWVKSTEVNYCELYDTEEHISEQAIKDSNCSLYPPGTILLAMYGQGTTRGRVAQLRTDATVNQAIAAIQVQDETESLFLYSMMKVCYDYVRNLAVGGNQHNLNLKLVSSIPLVVPPKELQQQFVSIAEQTNKSGFDGRKSQFIEMFGTPENNHNDYPVIKIGEMVESINYGTSKPATDNGKYVYLRMNNITYDGKLDLSEVKRINLSPEEDDSAFVHKGDLMFNRTNTKEFVGKTTVFNLDEQMVVAGYIIRVRFKEKYSPEYVSGYLNSTYGKALLRKMAKGAVHQANINAQEFQGIQVLDVPKQEQDKYVTIAKQADKSGSVLQYRIAC